MKFALDCAAEQVAVDLFLLSGQYADIATLSKTASHFKYPCYPSVSDFFLAKSASIVLFLPKKIACWTF